MDQKEQELRDLIGLLADQLIDNEEALTNCLTARKNLTDSLNRLEKELSDHIKNREEYETKLDPYL